MPSTATRVEAYAHALLEVARAEGHLGRRRGRAVPLRAGLRGVRRAADRAHRPARCPPNGGWRWSRTCSGGKALHVERRRSRRSSSPPAGPASCPTIVDRFVELAAAEQRHEVAEVRSAVAAHARADRAARARRLNQATGKDVEVKVVVDPTVLGGVVARVGDIVIDGSVRHRLEQLREQI